MSPGKPADQTATSDDHSRPSSDKVNPAQDTVREVEQLRDQQDSHDARDRFDFAAWERGEEQIRKLGGSLCEGTPWAPGQAYVGFRESFTDEGVEKLKEMPEIGKLDLRGTKVTDAG